MIARSILIFSTFLIFSGCSLLGQTNAENTAPANDLPTNSSVSLEHAQIPTAAPEEVKPPKMIFILDASGSMWGKVGSEEKIVSAKRVLKDSIGKLPADAQVGLIAYGHRSKSDCADIETIAPLGPLDKTGLSAKIDALDAKGKTPITDSLRKAIAEVKAMNLDETVKIVLISDGLETCTGDPCKLVREAKEAGVKITAHVIGFDTGKLTVAQLECIAQAGGGLYLNADDAAGLGAALDQAVSAEVSQYNNFISVKALADGKLADAVVKIVDTKTGKDVGGGRTYVDDSTNPRVVPLPVGVYDVIVKSVTIDGSPTITYEKIEVKAGEMVEKVADYSAGILKVKVTLNGELKDSTVTAVSEVTNKTVAGGRTYESKPFEMRLLPGKYFLKIRPIAVLGVGEFIVKDVIVKAGDKETFIEHDFEAGTLKIGTKRGTEFIDSVTKITDTQTGKVVGGARTYTSASSNPQKYIIKPGTYKIRVQAVRPAGIPPKEVTVTVSKDETVERMIEY
ncbi:MAG: VWA domain-containing protein [Pyrinomonadaceae bacterium]